LPTRTLNQIPYQLGEFWYGTPKIRPDRVGSTVRMINRPLRYTIGRPR
jgi:hypothetical protein